MLLFSAVGLTFDFVVLVENIHVAIVYDCLDVLHVALTHLNFISVEYLVKVFFVVLEKLSFLVVAILIYGEQITFRWQFLFLFSWLLMLAAW